MYARVLVGCDGSERGAAGRLAAERVAAKLGCPLVDIHVTAADDPRDLDTSDLEVVQGTDVAATLVDEARRTDPSGLLCLASRGRSAAGELLLGSVAAQVVRTLGAPLLIAGPGLEPPAEHWRRILVCLDGSEVAATILPYAAAWAQALDLEMELLHVAYPLGAPGERGAELPEEERLAAAQLRDSARALRRAGITVTPTVIEAEETAATIAREVQQRSSDLIAMTTHGRGALARLLTGSVAAEVIRRAPVPLLTLRPPHLR